ncbi:MAG: hypothetical protein WC262_06615, partial [Bacteroidales bacterium]
EVRPEAPDIPVWDELAFPADEPFCLADERPCPADKPVCPANGCRPRCASPDKAPSCSGIRSSISTGLTCS